MSRAHIPSFPNPIPKVDWLTYLPKFKDREGDDAAFHLINFHMHISRLKVQFHEDCLMKCLWQHWRRKQGPSMRS